MKKLLLLLAVLTAAPAGAQSWNYGGTTSGGGSSAAASFSNPISTLTVTYGATLGSATVTNDLLVGGTVTVQGNALSVGVSTFVVKGGLVGVLTATPAAPLDVNGAAQFGSTAKSTFTAAGNLAVPFGIVAATITTSGFARSVITVQSNITLTSTHSIVNVNCQAPCTITLPAASALGAGLSQELIFNNVSGSSATVTVTRAGSDLINSTNSFASNAGIDRMAWLNSDGATKWTGPVAFAPMMSPFRADSNTGQTMLSSGIVHMMVRVDAPGCLLGIRTVGYSTATSNSVVGVYAVEGGSSTVLLAASTQAHTNYNAFDRLFTYTISTPSVTAAQTTCLPIPGGTTIAVAIMDTDGFDAMPRCSAPISNGSVPFQGMLYDGTSRTAATNSLPVAAGKLTETNSRCYPFGFLWAGGLTQ